MVFYFVTVFSCKESEVGSGFSGQISKTKYGMSCQTWETVPAIIIPHVWKSQDVALTTQYLPRLKNFCRNPDDDQNGPWCFVDVASGHMEYCDVTKCGELLPSY